MATLKKSSARGKKKAARPSARKSAGGKKAAAKKPLARSKKRATTAGRAAPSRPRTKARAEGTIAAKPARASSLVQITVNGRLHDLELGRDLEPATTLATLLRDRLGFTGLKVACDEGACGGCTVLLDGKAVLSCMMLAVEAHGHTVVTIEGLPKDDPIVEAFAEQSEPGYGTALQCGFCTPGFVMTTSALLAANPTPTLEEIKEGLSGNICRCGCYPGIARAVQHASEKITERAARGGCR
jgi:aerobic carbon-monoxide dehydrogenase small subunit